MESFLSKFIVNSREREDSNSIYDKGKLNVSNPLLYQDDIIIRLKEEEEEELTGVSRVTITFVKYV